MTSCVACRRSSVGTDFVASAGFQSLGVAVQAYVAHFGVAPAGNVVGYLALDFGHDAPVEIAVAYGKNGLSVEMVEEELEKPARAPAELFGVFHTGREVADTARLDIADADTGVLAPVALAQERGDG